MGETRIVAGGFRLPEGARWHDEALWFVDVLRGNVHRLSGGEVETIIGLDVPASLAFRGDDLLVAGLQSRQLYTVQDGRIVKSLDLGWLAHGVLNDMVTDRQGRVYIDDIGHEPNTEGFAADGRILLVEPDGSARVVAEEILVPNGIAISPDGRQLVVGESWGPNGALTGAGLISFDIGGDGSLSNSRVLATIERGSGDGLCFDAEGGLWVCTASGHEAQRFLDGHIVERVTLPDQKWALACALGGPDLRTLFICTSAPPPRGDPKIFPGGWNYLGFTDAWIEAVEVGVPGIAAR